MVTVLETNRSEEINGDGNYDAQEQMELHVGIKRYNGVGDSGEDINGDGNYDALDCQGSDQDWYEVGTTDNPDDITDKIYTEGEVMIGKNASPGRKLEIREDAQYTGIRIRNTSSGGGFWDILSAGTGSLNEKAFSIWNGHHRFIIDDTGNVGIGVYDPDAKLELNGQIKITGGNPGEGRVLTSDADGLASWKRGDFNEYTLDYTNLSDGDWVTIAQVGDGAENKYRADGLFELQDRSGSHHHTLIFKAGVKFNKTYLKLESSNKYQSKRYSEIRIAYGSVYDGAVLQVKLDMSHSTPASSGYLRVYQNTNTDGWVINSGVVSADNAPVVYAASHSTSQNRSTLSQVLTLWI